MDRYLDDIYAKLDKLKPEQITSTQDQNQNSVNNTLEQVNVQKESLYKLGPINIEDLNIKIKGLEDNLTFLNDFKVKEIDQNIELLKLEHKKLNNKKSWIKNLVQIRSSEEKINRIFFWKK